MLYEEYSVQAPNDSLRYWNYKRYQTFLRICLLLHYGAPIYWSGTCLHPPNPVVL
ncbi:MAG: hypothetical protein KY428_08615 [Bacteroidetes bacterium]|nr:hypothetical protein [Bacteroidota bacterium]